jgi:hypothetical protein
MRHAAPPSAVLQANEADALTAFVRSRQRTGEYCSLLHYAFAERIRHTCARKDHPVSRSNLPVLPIVAGRQALKRSSFHSSHSPTGGNEEAHWGEEETWLGGPDPGPFLGQCVAHGPVSEFRSHAETS